MLGSLLITTIEEDDSFEITGLVATDCETGVNAWLYRFSSPIRTYALVERYLVYITDGIEETDLESRLVTLKVGDLNAREAPVEVTRTTIPKVDGVDQILIHDDCLYGRSFGELFKFDLTNDRLDWTREMVSSRLVAVEGHLLLIEANDKLLALDTDTGAVVWTRFDISGVTVVSVDYGH